jgi:hypothetical protein
VNAVDRGQHRRGEHRRGDRRGQAEHHHRPTAGLCDSGSKRMPLSGPQSEVLEELAGALEAVAAEPAEQLLGAVADEEAADGKA